MSINLGNRQINIDIKDAQFRDLQMLRIIMRHRNSLQGSKGLKVLKMEEWLHALKLT